MKLPQIPHDKANHIIYGLGIYYIVNLFFIPVVALCAAFVFSLANEIKDEYKYGGFDARDLAVTMICPIVLFLKEIV